MDFNSLVSKKPRGKKGQGRQVKFTPINLPVDLVNDLKLYRSVYSDSLPLDKDGNPQKVSFESMLRRWMERVRDFDPDIQESFDWYRSSQRDYEEKTATASELSVEQLGENKESPDMTESEVWDLKYYFKKDGKQVVARFGDRAPFYAVIEDRNVGMKEMLNNDWVLVDETGVELDYAEASDINRKIREHLRPAEK